MDHLLLTLSPEMMVYVPAAILRIQSLHPNLPCVLFGRDVMVRSSELADFSTLRKDLSHAIYREKIYTETLSMRQGLIELVRKR